MLVRQASSANHHRSVRVMSVTLLMLSLPVLLAGHCNPNRPGTTPVGQPCADNTQCVSNWCDRGAGTTNTGRCIPNDGQGQPGNFCTNPRHCQNNNCVDNTCQSSGGLGMTCSSFTGCISNRCDLGVGIGITNTGLCIPNNGQGQPGDFCTHNLQCADHNCPVVPPGRASMCGGLRP
jgi:hypothetical protein